MQKPIAETLSRASYSAVWWAVHCPAWTIRTNSSKRGKTLWESSWSLRLAMYFPTTRGSRSHNDLVWAGEISYTGSPNRSFAWKSTNYGRWSPWKREDCGKTPVLMTVWIKEDESIWFLPLTWKAGKGQYVCWIARGKTSWQVKTKVASFPSCLFDIVNLPGV